MGSVVCRARYGSKARPVHEIQQHRLRCESSVREETETCPPICGFMSIVRVRQTLSIRIALNGMAQTNRPHI